MYEQVFKNIDDILHKDAGCSSELDYVEQTSWVLFLKYLDDLEEDKKTADKLTDKTHENIIEPKFQWKTWAAPKLENGKIDHNAMTGDDLLDFVNGKLFPYLKKFKTDAQNANTIEYKIGEIFSELKNRIQSGYNLREELLENCNLHTVLDLPSGTFTGAGVKTVVLFFEKGKSTQKTWFYQLNLDRNLGKTNPLNEKDLAEFVELQKTKAESENSWTVNIKDIDQTTFDLSAKNPNTPEEAPLRKPKEILKNMADLDKESAAILNSISEML